MKRLYFIGLTLIALCLALNSYGVPAKPGIIEFEQPNGYVLNITLHGDEFVHWAQTTDGYTILQNKDGYYVYACQDKEGNLKLSEQIAHNPEDRLILEMAYVSGLKQDLRFSKQQINDTFKAWRGNGKTPKMGGFPTTGTNDLIMILANFSDTQTNYGQSDFDNYMNQTGYSGYGSFKDYYMEVSYGQLIVNTTVTVWVTVPNTHDYYGPQSKWSQFVRDAVQAADSQVDFSQFDNDGDGVVDGVAVIHQGRGQESSGNTNDIWSHNSHLSYNYYVNLDGVQIDAYTVQPELNASNSMSTIGVMCHEFGHNLGAPDYYDTDYATNGEYDGTGKWDVMANGSYNLSGKSPAHHNPYTKWKYYGWITPTLIDAEQTVTMENSAENSTDFYYYMTPSSDEFWLLENRQKIGFDSYVPGHGLVVYHADESHINYYYYSNSINAGSHQGFYPVCAFASGNPPATYGNINSGSTPFPGMLNNTEFTDFTTPSSTSWAGSATGKPITNIVETGTTISFDFMADVFVATFTVTENGSGDPITNASVTVGNQSVYTDASGVAILSLLDGTYDYTVSKYGYIDATGSITISGNDVTESVILEVAPIYFTLSFIVKNDETSELIEGAEIVVGGNTIYSDVNGEASIELQKGSYTYVINKSGFEEYTASVNLLYSDLTRNILMVPVYYPIDFTVYNEGLACDGASIDINGSVISTDVSGFASIELTNGTYAYTVTVDGAPDYNDEVVVDGEPMSVTVNMLGTEDVFKNSLTIYPNPAKDVLFIELEGNYQVALLNAIGRVVFEKEAIGLSSIDLNDFSEGVYFIKVEKEGRETIQKVIFTK
jgi:M6 family metalloprotease-like protein